MTQLVRQLAATKQLPQRGTTAAGPEETRAYSQLTGLIYFLEA